MRYRNCTPGQAPFSVIVGPHKTDSMFCVLSFVIVLSWYFLFVLCLIDWFWWGVVLVSCFFLFELVLFFEREREHEVGEQRGGNLREAVGAERIWSSRLNENNFKANKYKNVSYNV